MSRKKVLLLVTVLATLLACVRAQATYNTAQDFEAHAFIERSLVKTPRGLAIDDAGDILVISRQDSHIIAIYEDGGSVKTSVIVQDPNSRLNHGIVYNNGYLYASNDKTVYRWKYVAGDRQRVAGPPEVVVSSIPNGEQYMGITRSLKIGGNYLYVSVGVVQNAAEDESRAQVRRYNLEQVPTGGFEYDDGQKFATGVRNAVGLAFDSKENLWGADCGPSNLIREDLGGDIQETNPAEKLIKFSEGTFYGYPYCWTVDKLQGHPRGEQMAWPDYMNEINDDWCKNSENNHQPTVVLPAHSAPLGIAFYDGTNCDRGTGAFPCSMTGDAFIAFHGSINKSQPSGYNVVRVGINSQTDLPSGEIQDIFFDSNPSEHCLSTEAYSKCLRPVDLLFNQNGELIITSDSTDEIFKVSYKKKSDPVREFIRKAISFPGILAIIFAIIITVGVMGFITYRYCCCCKSDRVRYVRDQI